MPYETTHGNQIKDVNSLLRGKVWALLTYEDGSQFCFETTLNSILLRELGIVLEEGHLPRLDKKYYWNGRFIYRQFDVSKATLTLWDSLTYTHLESFKLHEFF